MQYVDYGTYNLMVSNAKKPKDATAVRHEEPVSRAALAVERAVEQVSSSSSVPPLGNEATFTTEHGCHEVTTKFTIRNETGMKIDRSYLPETFGKRSKRLLEEWTKAVVKVHSALGLSDEFSVGFVFSEDATALYERRSGNKIYYINPVSVEKCGTFRTMRSKKLDKNDLVAYATHEILHGIGYLYHDEDFAAALTYAMAKVFKHKV